MSIDEVLMAVQDSAIAHAISKSNHLVAASLQVVHVFGFVTLLAALLLISLRLLRWSFAQHTLAEVARDANRLLFAGLALVTVSGVLMFVATPQLYFHKPAFELKMLLFAIALLLQFALLRNVVLVDTPRTWAVRTLVGLSMVTWFGIGFAGRMIGFT